MWLRIAWVVCLFSGVSGCGTYCENPHTVVSSSDTQPGSVRIGVVLRAYASSTATLSDGRVLCLTCTGILMLDERLRETGRMDAEHPSEVAVGPDDSIYAVIRPPVPNGNPVDLAAFEPTGALRWRTHLSDNGSGGVLAGAQGPYAEFAGPGHEVVMLAFDAMSGARRQLHAPGQDLLGAAHDGVFTVERAPDAATLRQLDPAGAVVWARALTGVNLSLGGAVVTPDGGGIFFGRSEGTIDFGDRTLAGPPGKFLNFVVGIDPAGATRWAFTHEVIYTTRAALTAQGEILLAGRLDLRDGPDAFLSVATPAGVVRTHRIGGPADQDIIDLAASTDGLAWLEVASSGGEDDPPPVLRIGALELDENAQYLLGIVP
jgi:hypothetical protein